MGLTEREQYLFDLQGFLVIPGLIGPDELAALNAAADAHLHLLGDYGHRESSSALGGKPRQALQGMLTWDKPHCDPFRNFLYHQGLAPYLDDLMGRGWHADTPPLLIVSEEGTEGLTLHLGDHHWQGGAYYVYKNGEMRNGLMVAQLTLTDQNPGDGGFCCIPGSHKANFARPKGITALEEDTQIVVNPAAKAGDVLLFTEGLTHGTLPWTASHQRRAVHMRFSPKWVQYGPGFHQVSLPEWADELTDAQRAALEPAYFYNRPYPQDDGSAPREGADMNEPPYRYLTRPGTATT